MQMWAERVNIVKPRRDANGPGSNSRCDRRLPTTTRKYLTPTHPRGPPAEALLTGSLPGPDTLGAMDTIDWCGLIVRMWARLRFGVVVEMFTDGPYAGRLRVHGPYRFGAGTQAEWQGTLVYAIPLEALRRAGRKPAIAGGGDGGSPCLARGRTVVA